MYLAELRKLIKEKEDEARNLMSKIRENAYYKYTSTEEISDAILKPEKSMEEYIDELEKVNYEIFNWKSKLDEANSTNQIITPLGNYTLQQCVFLLRQNQAVYSSLECYKNANEKSRDIDYNGNVEYKVANFDVEGINNELVGLKQSINDLQLAIDRANLTIKVEI